MTTKKKIPCYLAFTESWAEIFTYEHEQKITLGFFPKHTKLRDAERWCHGQRLVLHYFNPQKLLSNKQSRYYPKMN